MSTGHKHNLDKATKIVFQPQIQEPAYAQDVVANAQGVVGQRVRVPTTKTQTQTNKKRKQTHTDANTDTDKATHTYTKYKH